jgi:predicted dehydrogenase
MAGAGAAPPKANDRVRVAVVGCGSVSRMYFPNLKACPSVELVAACDIRPERAERAAAKFGVPRHYPSVEALLDGTPFDLMVTLTDMQQHGRLNRMAIEAGRHVWSEKPIANTHSEAKALVDLARSKGIRVWGAPTVVNSPQFAFMERALREGALGRVAQAHAAYGHLGPGWSAFFYEKDGGSMPDLGVYNFTTLTGLLGPARSVVAMTSIVTPERTVDDKGTIRVEAEDNAMVLLDHGRGALSHVQCSFNDFDPHGHDGATEAASIQITGTGGRLELLGYDWGPKGVRFATEAHPAGQMHARDTEGYVWEQGASVVAECLATGKEPRIQVEHALHVVEIIEAARKSQETGRRIELTSTFPWPIPAA